jgi:hypothetical protein
MLNDDYSPSNSGDEEPSTASHVDLGKVVGAIDDELGARYSGKYTLGSFVKYNGQKYTPRKREIVQNETRPDGMVFDRSKGHCTEFYQAVFGFPKSLSPSQYGKGKYRVKTHLHQLFSITAARDFLHLLLALWGGGRR